MLEEPDSEPIALDQSGYDEFISVCDICCQEEKDSKKSEPFLIIESTSESFFYKGKEISLEEATYLTELAMHVTVRRLKISIRHKISGL